MKLVSNINLKYSFGDVNGDTEEGIVECSIKRPDEDTEGNINFLYSYSTPEGVKIKTAWLEESITKEELDELYTAVASTLPDINAVGYSAWNNALRYEAARVKMATTFKVSVDKINIDNE